MIDETILMITQPVAMRLLKLKTIIVIIITMMLTIMIILMIR